MSNSESPTSTDPFSHDQGHWVAGIFYVDHENPRLLVPKRLEPVYKGHFYANRRIIKRVIAR